MSISVLHLYADQRGSVSRDFWRGQGLDDPAVRIDRGLGFDVILVETNSVLVRRFAAGNVRRQGEVSAGSSRGHAQPQRSYIDDGFRRLSLGRHFRTKIKADDRAEDAQQ